MKRNKLGLCLIILICLAVVSWGLQPCYARQIETIRVGVLLPLTGTWSEAGQGAHKALMAGIGQVNHYLNDSALKLELDIRDTEGKPQKALHELESFARQGIHIVIGPMSSEEAKAVNQFAADHALLLASPSATATELSQKDNFFRVIPTDWNQVDGLMKIMSREEITRFAVAYRDDVFGRGFCEQLQKAAAINGKEMIGGVPLPSSTDGYNKAAGQLKRMVENADVEKTAILLIGSGRQAAEFIKNISADSPLARLKWFAGAEIIGSKEFTADRTVAAFAALTRMEGLSIGYRGIALDVLPYINYFLNGAADISPYALTTWDSLWLIAETCRKNPQADAAALKSALTATAKQFRNSYGLINAMDENGDTLSARYLRYQLYREDNGDYVWRCKGHYVNPVISAPIIQTMESRVAKESGEIRIGALLSLRGDAAEEGKEVQAVLGQAVACFNQYASDSGSGLKIKLLVEDTASDPQTAAAAAKKLMDQGVKNIIGPLSSTELAAVEPVLRHGARAISPMSTAPSLSKKDHIYRLVMNDTYQARTLAALLKQDDIKKVIVLYRNDVYGQDLAAAFRAAFAGKVFPLGYDTGSKNFVKPLAQAEQWIASEGKDNTAVLVIAYNEIADIMRFEPGSSLNDVRWYGTDSTALKGSLSRNALVAQTAARVRFTAVGYSAYGNYFDPLYHVMNYRLAEKIPHPLKENSISAFDALWMIGCAYLENGTFADSQIIEEYVQKAAFRGVSGLVAMNEYGDRSVGYYRIYRFEGNEGKYRWSTIGLYSLDYAKKGVIEMVK